MLLKIDTQNKTVSVESWEKIGDVVEEMKKLFPETWKEFKLISETIVIREFAYQYPYVWTQPVPQLQPWITCATPIDGVEYSGDTSTLLTPNAELSLKGSI